ncbi:hypothetical protein LTR78_009344 [Recurvomyces mirabilis]|uniref:Uncharacterized protein n=1 Tax=Recurvomyces mirabilis TaxID=574656 RepID=A0AAE0TNS9_9PEZI|nr:hypothetical protein LTR78_009344 [Recurvomyces mirabilis]
MADDTASTDLCLVIAYADKVHLQLAAVTEDEQDAVLARLSQELLNHELGLQAAYSAILTRAAGQRDGPEPAWLQTLRKLSDLLNPSSAFAELGGIVGIAWAWREPAVEYTFQELGSRSIARLATLATVLPSWNLAVQRINAAMISRHLAAESGRKFLGSKAIRVGLHFPGEKIRDWQKPIIRVDIEFVLQNARSNPPVLFIGNDQFPDNLDSDIDEEARSLLQSVADDSALVYTVHGLLVPSKSPTKRPRPKNPRDTASKKQITSTLASAPVNQESSRDGFEHHTPAEASPPSNSPCPPRPHPERSGKRLPEHLLPQDAGLRLPTRATSPSLFIGSDRSDSGSSDGTPSSINEHEEVQSLCGPQLPDKSAPLQAPIEPGNAEECSGPQNSAVEVNTPDLVLENNERVSEAHSDLNPLDDSNFFACFDLDASQPSSPRRVAIVQPTSAAFLDSIGTNNDLDGLESSVTDAIHDRTQSLDEQSTDAIHDRTQSLDEQSTDALGDVVVALDGPRAQPSDATTLVDESATEQTCEGLATTFAACADLGDLSLPLLDTDLDAFASSSDFPIDALSTADFEALFSESLQAPLTTSVPLATSNDSQVVLDLIAAATRIENFMTKTSVHQTGPGPSSVNYAAVRNWIMDPQSTGDHAVKVVDGCDSIVILPQEPVHFTRLSASSIDLGVSTPAWKLLVLNDYGVLLEAAGSSYNWIRSAEGRQVCVVIEPKPANAAYPVILEPGASLLLPHNFTYFVVQATTECIIQVVTYPKP